MTESHSGYSGHSSSSGFPNVPLTLASLGTFEEPEKPKNLEKPELLVSTIGIFPTDATVIPKGEPYEKKLDEIGCFKCTG